MNQQFPAALRIMNPVSTLQGARDSLAAINTTLLPDNALVMVEASNTLYVLRKASTATEDSPNIIAPDEGGPGRWYRYGAGGGFFSTVTVAHTTVPPQSQLDVTGVTVPGYASSSDVVSFSLAGSNFPSNNLVVGLPRNTAANQATWSLYNIGSATIAPEDLSLRVCVHTSP